jgi:ATP-dependent RNA helicase RhlE
MREMILNKFEVFGLSPVILRAVSELGYDEPTPIQMQGIPLVMQGLDLMGLAQTGTGKTAAFGLPLVQHLMKEKDRPKAKEARALILAPTRELANQIAENIRSFVKHAHLRVNVVVGGSSINVQRQKLGRGTDILVATPGRLMDLVERKAVYLDMVKYLVLDEADQMLDLGFINVLKDIASMLGEPRQTLLFSATMPKSIEDLSKAFLKDPKKIQVSPPGTAVDKISQSVHFIGNRTKADLLKNCLTDIEDDYLALVFCRTKHGSEKLKKHLVERGFKAGSIHGNKSQGQRDRAIREFKSGEIKILVATDVAARGIDISGVSHVFNYDLPEVAENYVHRIGRTARAGKSGEAVAFCAPAEISHLRAIEKLMKISIKIASGEMSEEVEKANSGKKKRVRNRPKNKNPNRDRNAPQAQKGENKEDRPARSKHKRPKRKPSSTSGASDANNKRKNKPSRKQRMAAKVRAKNTSN